MPPSDRTSVPLTKSAIVAGGEARLRIETDSVAERPSSAGVADAGPSASAWKRVCVWPWSVVDSPFDPVATIVQ